MPLRRSVRGHPARRNVEEQELPNAPEVQLQGEVTNAEFREAIRMLSQAVTNQLWLHSSWNAAMLIGDMDMSRLMVYVQQVEEEKLRNREEFRNKRAKTGNESGQQKGNVNRSSFQQRQRGPAPSSVSAPAPRNKSGYAGQNSQNFRAGPAQSQNSIAQESNRGLACARRGEEEEEEKIKQEVSVKDPRGYRRGDPYQDSDASTKSWQRASS
uniref:Gag-pol polyprotein n=1 Tax=Solanum tuberosum TaxID=4113 RepID=M1DTQ2_SOLTU